MDKLIEHALQLAPELCVLVYLVVRTNNNIMTLVREQNAALDRMAERLGENTTELSRLRDGLAR